MAGVFRSIRRVDLGGARLDRLRGVGGDVVGGHAELDGVEADVAVPPAVDSGEDDANVVLPGVELEGAVADGSADRRIAAGVEVGRAVTATAPQ